MCPKDADQAHKAVGMNAGSDAASNISSSGIASSVTPPENDCPSQDNDCSKRLSPSDEGRPVSRKMARKLKKMGATSNKESRLEYAEKVSASIEIPSKPRSSKPRKSNRKVAPAPKQAYKVDLSHYKAKSPDKSALVDDSCAEIVSTAQQMPWTSTTNWIKLDRDQSIMTATKHSKKVQKSASAAGTSLQDLISTQSTGKKCPTLAPRSLPVVASKAVQNNMLNDVSWPMLGATQSTTATLNKVTDPEERIKAVVSKDTSNTVKRNTLKGTSCQSRDLLPLTQKKAVVQRSKKASSAAKVSDSDQRIKAILPKQTCNAVKQSTMEVTPCPDLGSAQCTKKKSGSGKLFVSEDGRPVSRKMSRKLKKMDANSDKKDHVEHAEKVNVSMEISSKPRNSKPRAGKRKVAPAPKHASKTGPNALVHASSCAETVPTARQVPCPTATNCTKLDQNQTIMMATKHSKEQLFRQEEEHEGEKCIPVEKRKIYKNNMTKEEYLDLLEQDIFEKGLLDHVSTNWCLEQLD